MPGYGASSKNPGHAVSLDVQGELLTDLLGRWDLRAPHVVAHDYGGAVALRARLLHGAQFASLALVDVVALAPSGSTSSGWSATTTTSSRSCLSPFTRGAARLHRQCGLRRPTAEQAANCRSVARPVGQAAFYRQIAQADQAFTDAVEPLYPSVGLPALIVRGEQDRWIPVDRARRLAASSPAPGSSSSRPRPPRPARPARRAGHHTAPLAGRHRPAPMTPAVTIDAR